MPTPSDPLLSPAPAWDQTCGEPRSHLIVPMDSRPRSEVAVLWHGCQQHHADSIIQHGVQPRYFRPGRDFGPGFYTTTIEQQARHWAWENHYDTALPDRTSPVVIRFVIERERLANLATLMFVAGHYSAEDYWSFVQMCRQQTAVPGSHDRDNFSEALFDVVCGPVAAFWRQRVAMQDADQFSFHTDRAIAVLNGAILHGNVAAHAV